MDDIPKNEVIITQEPVSEPAAKKPRVRSKAAAKVKVEEVAMKLEDAPENRREPALVKMDLNPLTVEPDQRAQTMRTGRRTRLPKIGPNAIAISEVDYTIIKDTKDPLSVRDQLMREYFASQKHTDELVQKLCALVFKHH